jgi:hypothetical protein
MTKHKILTYKQDELYTTRQEYTAEADSDAEATIKIQELRRAGHTISGWIQNADTSQSKDVSGKSNARR